MPVMDTIANIMTRATGKQIEAVSKMPFGPV